MRDEQIKNLLLEAYQLAWSMSGITLSVSFIWKGKKNPEYYHRAIITQESPQTRVMIERPGMLPLCKALVPILRTLLPQEKD